MTFEEVIAKHGTLVYQNVGVSMLPWIHEGKDLMVIETVPEKLKKYDAVLFIRPHVTGRGRYVLHRIIKCYKDGSFYIMGDNTISGERVCPEHIIGILTKIQQPDKLIDVQNPDYLVKVWLWWHFCLPVRTVYRRVRRWISLMIRKIFRIDTGVSIREHFKI